METIKNYFNILINLYIENESHWIISSVIMGASIVLAIVIFYIFNKTIIERIKNAIKNSRSKFGNLLIKNSLFKRGFGLFFISVLYSIADSLPNNYVAEISTTFFQIYAIFAVILFIFSLLDTINDFTNTLSVSDRLPIKAIVQMTKIIIVLIGALIFIATLMDKSLLVLLSSIGAFSAILLLVFKEVLLNMVALMQIKMQNAIKNNDWIEIKEYNADGVIDDISLNGIVILNWDNTTSIVPPSALLTHGVKNYRTIHEKGRRIKRTLYFNVNSVRFLTDEEIKKFENIYLIEQYIKDKKNEIANSKVSDNNINNRRLTNIGTFRKYAENYLKANQHIMNDEYIIVRQKENNGRGIPIEIYCFTKSSEWYIYENLQSDLFDHFYAIAHEFGLTMFQEFTNIH